MSDPSPDNQVPFPNREEPACPTRPPTSVRDILATQEAAQDFEPGELVRTALELVGHIDARHGGDVLVLALAIGCLCRANQPRGEPPK